MTSTADQSQNTTMTQEQKLNELKNLLPEWAKALGFAQVGVCDTDLGVHSERFRAWLASGYHGSMEWMSSNADLRENPALLVPGALRVISVRMNYWVPDTEPIQILKSEEKAYISRYAMGRDYHKLIRKRLAKLANKIEHYCNENQVFINPSQRAFVDSAPILERPFAEKAGLGSVGKHTLLIHREEGSYFFLGEILTNVPLPVDEKSTEDLCGTCNACLKVCPTDAFPQAYQLDARRCISYLTIENKGSIPFEFREPMGNRVFGCDDCQVICPWNKSVPATNENDFQPRHSLNNSDLVKLFLWSEEKFLANTQGSAIRRIGYHGWRRNLSVGLGNAPHSNDIVQALNTALNALDAQEDDEHSAMLREHYLWALDKQTSVKQRRKRKIKRI